MDQKNLILAIALSVGIILLWEVFISGPQREAELQQRQQQIELQAERSADAEIAPSLDGQTTGVEPGGPGGFDRAQALEQGPRLRIETPTLDGTINLIGARFDDLTLLRYRETIDDDSPNIELLQPVGTATPYFARFDWTSVGGLQVPGPDAVWEADVRTLTTDQPATLTWQNDSGLTFVQEISIDEDYLFTVTKRVINQSGDEVTLAPYGAISRSGTPATLDFFILHEGMIGVLGEELFEISYDDIRDDRQVQAASTGGWIGITDKYWMTTLVPDQQTEVQGRFLYSEDAGVPKYQTDFIYQPLAVPAGGSAEVTTRMFLGAKQATLLDSYAEEYSIDRFDLAVDFGWFYFLTKPIFLALHWLNGVIGNFGVSILVLTVGIKLVFFPLANKSYLAMARMRKLQPQMLEMRERFGDDKQRLNQEMMALYKKEGANPLAGCLPILIQIPVFFALYKVLFVTIEMRHAPFFGWIQDLSAPDPTTVLNLFGLLPWDAPELGLLNILNLGIWPLLMGISMFIQQKLNPQPADPMQAKIFLAMPIVFTFLLSTFPAGLVIYWTWNNTLSVLQQAVIMKRAGVPFGNKGRDILPKHMRSLGKDKGQDDETTDQDEDAAETTNSEKTAANADAAPDNPTPSNPGPSKRERKRSAKGNGKRRKP
ncbi:membrane protein insertase YidC [Algihabitans albus]|uniref:membrane protein insertase YidC n=1 Tax=Algihabitans albus TaxID=2164067 RepID=UPI000E5C5C49|nr:membrane protein insertase YidC [Algihabitans albus]